VTLPKNRYFPRWLNSLLVFLQNNEWRGKHKFYLFLTQYFEHKVIVHKVDNREFCVPFGEWCLWLERGPENYYLDEFIPFCELLNDLQQPFVLFDLGADIGTVSSLVASHCQKLQAVVAFEPNPKSFELLSANLSQLSQICTYQNLAVSDFVGSVNFISSAHRANDHEGRIDPKNEGDTEVTSLDEWAKNNSAVDMSSTLVVKIDVEGQELQVIAGAKKLLEQANKVILLLEIHPSVLKDTNTTPEELFEQAEALRSFTWFVPANNGQTINRNQPFFSQFSHKQYDVIGVSQ
jgi:FkbM family methyltransferase